MSTRSKLIQHCQTWDRQSDPEAFTTILDKAISVLEFDERDLANAFSVPTTVVQDWREGRSLPDASRQSVIVAHIRYWADREK